MKHWAQFAGQSSEAGWLMGILRNKVIDYFRGLAREQNFTDIEFLADERETFFDKRAIWNPKVGPKPWPQPDESMETAEFWRVFDRLRQSYPPRWRRSSCSANSTGSTRRKSVRNSGCRRTTIGSCSTGRGWHCAGVSKQTGSETTANSRMLNCNDIKIDFAFDG